MLKQVIIKRKGVLVLKKTPAILFVFLLVLFITGCGTIKQGSSFSERKYFNFGHHDPVVVFNKKPVLPVSKPGCSISILQSVPEKNGVINKPAINQVSKRAQKINYKNYQPSVDTKKNYYNETSSVVAYMPGASGLAGAPPPSSNNSWGAGWRGSHWGVFDYDAGIVCLYFLLFIVVPPLAVLIFDGPNKPFLIDLGIWVLALIFIYIFVNVIPPISIFLTFGEVLWILAIVLAILASFGAFDSF